MKTAKNKYNITDETKNIVVVFQLQAQLSDGISITILSYLKILI
jgi:hypothetical protein